MITSTGMMQPAANKKLEVVAKKERKLQKVKTYGWGK